MIRPSSIYEDYLRQPAKPDVPATVLVVSQQGTVDVQLASGEVLRRVDLAGAASAGDRVMLRYDDHGNYTALGSRPSSAASGAAFVTATGSGGSGGSGTIPDPHDLLGAHHTLPTVSAGQVFAAPASSSGTPSFRALATTDLPTLTVSAGDGLTGGGNLPSITLNVGAGDGITVGASTVSVQRAATSGLSFNGTGLQVDDSIAGAGLTIASKVLKLADGVAGAGLSINTTTKAISVSAGDGISVASSPSAVAVNSTVARSSWKVNAGAGLAVTNSGNLSASGPTFSVSLAAISGLNTTSGLAVGAGAGISVLASTVAVDTGYAFTWSAAHTFSANATFSAGLTATRLTGSSNVLELANNTAFQSESFSSGFAGDGWRITRPSGAGTKASFEIDNLTVRGSMRVYELLINQIRATNGSVLVSSTGKVATAAYVSGTGGQVGATFDFTTDANTNHGFLANDIIIAKRATGTNQFTLIMRVAAAPAPTTTTWRGVILSVAGTVPVTSPEYVGLEFVRIGNTTDASRQGSVYLSADDSGAPFVQIVDGVAAAADWNAASRVRARFGNLNGSYGYTSNTYGIAAGSSTNYMAADANGFRVANNSVVRFAVDTQGNISLSDSGGVQRMALTSTGVFVAGDTATSSIWADATNGFRVRNNNVSRFSVDTSGNVALRDGAGVQRIGLTSAGVIELDDATGAARVLIDSGGLKLRDSNGNAAITLDASGNSQFTGVMTIGASGEIRQGTGTVGTNFQGVRIWNSGTVGRIAGYNSASASPQWYADTDGKLYAGGGNVSLSADGISIDTNGVQPNPVQKQLYGFVPYDAGTGLPIAGAYAGLSYYRYNKLRTEGELVLTHDTSAASSNTYIEILSYAAASYLSEITLEARSGTTRKSLYVSAADGVRIPGGLNVGSASSAATGEIRTSSASNPRIIIESTGSASSSRSFLRFSGTVANEFISIGYYPDGSPRRMQINYNGESVSLPIMSLTSANRVGINMQTPSYALDVSGDIRANGGLNVGSATGADTGDVKFSGSIVGTGAEGLRTTWTPTFEWSGGGTGTFTYATQSAVYTKIANVVYIAARIALSGFTIGTSTGNLRISNLPFTVANITPLPVVSVAGCSNWTTVTPDRGIFFNNTTYLLLYSGPLTTQTIGTANVSATSSIYVSGFYYTT